MEDNKNYELDCLVRSIKEVEVAKKQKPEMYKKALGILKGEVEAVSSIADLRKIKAAKAEAVDVEDEGEEDADE